MFFSPTKLMQMTIKTGLMMTEVQMAVGLRLLGMGTIWTRPTSTSDPVAEKLAAPEATAKPSRVRQKKTNVTPFAAKARARKA